MRPKRHPGEVIGRLTLLERADPATNGASRWRCRCDCGTELTVNSSNLSGGNTRSCGCLRVEACRERERKKDHPTHGPILSYYKRNAKDRSLSWDLDIETFSTLVTSDCFYCGNPPAPRSLHWKTRQGDVKRLVDANGIDRVDNSQGYTAENVVPCCASCNKAKGTMSVTEFLELARRIVAHQGGG